MPSQNPVVSTAQTQQGGITKRNSFQWEKSNFCIISSKKEHVLGGMKMPSAASFQKEKVKIGSVTWRAVGCHEKAIIAEASGTVIFNVLTGGARTQADPSQGSEHAKHINGDVPQQIQPQHCSALLASVMHRISHEYITHMKGFCCFS